MIKIVAPISNPKTELDEKEGDVKLVDQSVLTMSSFVQISKSELDGIEMAEKVEGNEGKTEEIKGEEEEIEPIKQVVSLRNEVKKVGVIIDRGMPLEFRPGDTLLVYISMGGFEK